MNYTYHYNKLIQRAKHRKLNSYYERHHIIPKCLNGSDDSNNIVNLTPEEHYIAHLLLIKMYPNNDKLIYAARMLTITTVNQKRNNKIYGWLKERYHIICKTRTGSNNPSYGKSWYHNPNTLENGKFLKSNIPIGWVKGRKIKKHNFTTCIVCLSSTDSLKAKYCYQCRKIKKIKDNSKTFPNSYVYREQEFIDLYKKFKSSNKALKHMGYTGNQGALYIWTKKLINSIED